MPIHSSTPRPLVERTTSIYFKIDTECLQEKTDLDRKLSQCCSFCVFCMRMYYRMSHSWVEHSYADLSSWVGKFSFEDRVSCEASKTKLLMRCDMQPRKMLWSLSLINWVTQAVSTQFYISCNGYAFKKEGSTDK